MKRFVFKKLDAFADGNSSGNPAGCIYLKHCKEITSGEMQGIARELKGFVNEVVYVFPEKDYFFLKYYSSECEVDFCGHGTIAAMYDLIKGDKALLGKPQIRIIVREDFLVVMNSINEKDCVYIQSPKPEYLKVGVTEKEVVEALSIKQKIIDSTQEFSFINAGLRTLIVPIKGLCDCLSIHPDQEKLRKFCINKDIDIVLVFTGETAFKNNLYRTRVFAPKFGYLEDPATGSGNSAFGYYLLKHKLWAGEDIRIEQSGDKKNPNIINLCTTNEFGTRRVLFGGKAVARIEGEYILY